MANRQYRANIKIHHLQIWQRIGPLGPARKPLARHNLISDDRFEIRQFIDARAETRFGPTRMNLWSPASRPVVPRCLGAQAT